jgi:hypothetical protein
MRVEYGNQERAVRSYSSAALVVAAVVQTGCAGGHEPEIGPQPIDPANAAVAIAYDAGARELVIELPPVDLPANASHEIEQPQPGEAVMPVGGWLQGYRVEVLDAKGNAVPREVIHHVNIMAPERRELFSPIMQRIGGVGHETAPVVIPGVLGYPIEEGGRILISAMLHNPTPHPYQGVRIRVRFRHESRGLIDPFDVFPFYMDVTPPAELHSFDLPPGHSETSWEGSPAVPGRILGVGGHAHQYAVALKLLDVTEDRILYETAPITDDDGTVIGMAQDFFLTRLGIPVHPDHTYRLSVVYENPTGEVIPDGGMGALGGIFAPSRGARWPAVDPTDAEYIKDYEIRTTPHWTEMRGAPGSSTAGDGHSGHVHR